MSKMNRKKDGPGDKIHTIIDKNCTLKQIKNNKVLRTMQLDKAECARQRKNLKTKNIPASQTSSATQTYNNAKPAAKASLKKSQVDKIREQYIQSKDKKTFFNSLPKVAQQALRTRGTVKN